MRIATAASASRSSSRERSTRCRWLFKGRRGKSHLFDWDRVLEWFEAEAEREQLNTTQLVSATAGVLLSCKALAGEFGVHQDTMASRLAAWRIEPVQAVGKGDLYRLRDVIERWLMAQRVEDPESLPAHEQHAYYRSQVARDELRLSRSELMETSAVLSFANDLVRRLADACDLIPDRLEATGGLTPDLIEAVEKQLDAARGEIRGAFLEWEQQQAEPG